MFSLISVARPMVSVFTSLWAFAVYCSIIWEDSQDFHGDFLLMDRFFLFLIIGELLESSKALCSLFQGDKLLFLSSEEASYTMGEIS